ncbi:MAG TPA: GAF domain-containing protein, partial [Streptomyces sp.]
MGGFGITGDRADAGDAAHFSELLDAALAHVTRASGATRGMLYVLPPGSPALWLAVMTGSQHEIAMPWTRVELTEPLPAADAVREQRLVWVDGMQEAARVYPRLTLVLPYDFALAAAPLGSGNTVWGCLVLVWPGSRRTELGADERAVIDKVRGRLDRDLRETVGFGSLRAPERPRIMPTLGPASSTAAAAFADRLPGGCCALDASGRVTFVTPAGAELLGADVPGLLGARLWEVLPW